jgi:tripartite ATP-independent transporter DctM subunit
MIALSPEIVTLIMLVGVLVGVLLGYHLAIVVGALGLGVGFMLWGPMIFDLFYVRIFSLLTTYILLAIPFFIFMGTMLEKSGIMDGLFDASHLWFGSFRGGLAIVTVLIGTAMAASVGVIAASVTVLTLTALAPMIQRGYQRGLASGTICASGTLGILIPPSVMLVLYGPMAGISVGRLFFGAIIPGLVLAGLYCIYIAIRSFLQPGIAPAAPAEQRVSIPIIRKIYILLVAVVPVFALILGVLGTIMFGIAAPTEAAAVGALVATLLAVLYRKFSFKALKETVLTTMRMSGMILLIASLAFGFVGVFIRAGGGAVMENIILAVPFGRWGSFAVIMFVIFMLGKFIDWIGVLFIMVPIITPIAIELGFDPLWMALMVCINLQMSFLTPPFAYAIFFVQGTAPPELGVTTSEIIRGVIPFIIIIIIVLVLCTIFPEIILWLPNKVL